MTYFASNLLQGKHCFFGAEGGVSQGFYRGLNVNQRSSDDPARLRQNLEIVAGKFGFAPQNLHLLVQGVSNHVEYVEKATQNVMEADGAVTDRPDVVLCIRTADCAPVLLADYQSGVIGAAHCGWRGAFKGVVENTLRLMLDKGARLDRIAAAVGPCIAQDSYEVDRGFYELFAQENPRFASYFKPGKTDGFYQFDLESFVKDRLLAFGVQNVSVSGLDTYALEDDYYSFRRFTHQGLIKAPKDFPTEISCIVL